MLSSIMWIRSTLETLEYPFVIALVMMEQDNATADDKLATYIAPSDQSVISATHMSGTYDTLNARNGIILN